MLVHSTDQEDIMVRRSRLCNPSQQRVWWAKLFTNSHPLHSGAAVERRKAFDSVRGGAEFRVNSPAFPEETPRRNAAHALSLCSYEMDGL
jgi:hypothetical protein